MENNANKAKEGTQHKNVVEKVVAGERASLGDEPLTPPKKMQAEQARMKKEKGNAEERHEEDRQQAHLGDAVLTPQKKMEKARLEAQQEARQEERQGINIQKSGE